MTRSASFKEMANPDTAALGRDIVRKVRRVRGVAGVQDHLSSPDVYPIVADPVF